MMSLRGCGVKEVVVVMGSGGDSGSGGGAWLEVG